jgi:hypothetical protein
MTMRAALGGDDEEVTANDKSCFCNCILFRSGSEPAAHEWASAGDRRIAAADALRVRSLPSPAARLLTVSHGTIENGVLVMAERQDRRGRRGGKVKIPGAQIVDAKGMTVYPGLIDPETNFGLIED